MVTLVGGLLRGRGYEVVWVFAAMRVLVYAMKPPSPEAILIDDEISA